MTHRNEEKTAATFARQLTRTLTPESPGEASREPAASSGSSQPRSARSPAGSHHPDLPYSLCKSWKRHKNQKQIIIIIIKNKIKK